MSKTRSQNFRTAMERSAQHRRCPDCGRKSALSRITDHFGVMHSCRWEDCWYLRIYVFEADRDVYDAESIKDIYRADPVEGKEGLYIRRGKKVESG